MRLRELEMLLQRIPSFIEPSAELEQYSTPAPIAADMLYTALGHGAIDGRTVLDLGCGSGILGIGAWLLGAERVIGIDASEKAVEQARVNSGAMDAEIELHTMDVRDVGFKVDTVIMNPPFGCQNRNADRAFLDKAMDSASSVYSLHMSNTLPFLDRHVASKGRELWFHKEYKYDIPHLFSFHSRSKRTVDIVMIAIR